MYRLKIITNICIIIALYYLVYYVYAVFLNPLPILGDSWDYHIPIARNILDGNFFSEPPKTIPNLRYPGTQAALHQIPQWYYPGAGEAILALFIFLHIPLTFYNIFATLALFMALYYLGKTFKLDTDFSLLFAVAVCTLNVVLRWQNAVIIDIWVGVFFTLALLLLENPRKTWEYFVKLGLSLGILLGSKYTAVLFVIVLLLLYGKKLLRYMNINRTFAVLIPVILFGLFWYIRNFFLTGNPIYPLPHLSVFRIVNPFTFYNTIWIVTVRHPLEMFDAAFEEYKLWLFSVLFAAFVLVYQFVFKRKFSLNSAGKLFILGLLNLACFFTFLSSDQVWIMVSDFRYSLPVFIPLILGMFLLAVKYSKQELLGYIVIANMISSLSMAYYPKLVLIYLPLGLFILWYRERGKKLKA